MSTKMGRIHARTCVYSIANVISSAASTNHKTHMKSRVLLSIMKLVWILTCCIGCFTQIIMLVVQYMEYEVSTRVAFAYPDIMVMPLITFCTRLTWMMDWNDSHVKSVCLNTFGNESCHRRSTANFTNVLSDQIVENLFEAFTIPELINATHRADSIIKSYVGFDQNYEYVSSRNLAETFDITEFITSAFKCYTLKWKPELDNKPFWSMRRKRRALVYLSFNPDVKARVKQMYLIYSSHQYYYADTDLVTVSLEHQYSISSYDVIETTILPAPFASDCIVYSIASTKSVTRASCYEYCFGNYSMRYFGFMTRVQDMRLDSFYAGKTSYGDFAAKNRERIKWISKMCDNICRKSECHQIVYLSKIKSSDTTASDNTRHGSYMPSSPTVKAQSLAKISFESFATDLSSTFGFWLGVSVFSLLESIMIWVRRIANYRCNKDRDRVTIIRMPRKTSRRRGADENINLFTFSQSR